MKKGLIAYYSRAGQNYVNGRISMLEVGNTEVVARKIQSLTSAELFKIDTLKDYPVEYTETTRVAKDELRSAFRPELATILPGINEYDIIYLGFPNWWGTFPMAVFTFLEAFDFSGKIIMPFCTHEGSGLGKSIRDIERSCPGANVHDGLALQGSTVARADEQIKHWLTKEN